VSDALDDEMETCPACGELVEPMDLCPEHEVCLWCDLDCKYEAAYEDPIEA
jgi:hypothetical protein